MTRSGKLFSSNVSVKMSGTPWWLHGPPCPLCIPPVTMTVFLTWWQHAASATVLSRCQEPRDGCMGRLALCAFLLWQWQCSWHGDSMLPVPPCCHSKSRTLLWQCFLQAGCPYRCPTNHGQIHDLQGPVDHGEHGARAYNVGLGAKSPAGYRGSCG